LASGFTLAFLIVLLRSNKQQEDQNRNEDENENYYTYQNLSNNGDNIYMNEAKSYYTTIQEQTLSIIMLDYEPYWQLVVLSSLAAFFTSLVTIARNIQIFVSQNRQLLQTPCALTKSSSTSCCTTSCTSKVINAIATVLNIVSYIGLVIAVIYKAEESETLHYIGAVLFFVGTAIYAVLHSYLLWTQQQQQYNILLKILFTLLATVIASTSIVFGYSLLDNVFSEGGSLGIEVPVFEWVAIFATAISIGFFTILFYVDSVDDEIRDFLVFFCCIDRCCKSQRC